MKSMLYYLGNVTKKTETISVCYICPKQECNQFVEYNCKI